MASGGGSKACGPPSGTRCCANVWRFGRSGCGRVGAGCLGPGAGAVRARRQRRGRTPRGGRGLPAPDRDRRAVPGESVRATRVAVRRRTARSVRARPACRPAAVWGACRRCREPLARAVPPARRTPGMDRADQGDAPADGLGRGPPRRARCAARVHQGRGRARDDRRPDAQRSRPGVRVRNGAGARAAGRATRRRVAPGLDRDRPAARGGARRRAAARHVSARLGHRGAKGPGDEGDRDARGHPARGLHGGDRDRQPDRRARHQCRDPDLRDRGRRDLDGRRRRDRRRLRPRAGARGGACQGGRTGRRYRRLGGAAVGGAALGAAVGGAALGAAVGGAALGAAGRRRRTRAGSRAPRCSTDSVRIRRWACSTRCSCRTAGRSSSNGM